MRTRRRAGLRWADRSVSGDTSQTSSNSASGGLEVAGSSLFHQYQGPSGVVPVLQDVTFHIPQGGYAALVGASGAGKTTLLTLIGGLERVQYGGLLVGGHEVADLEGDSLAAFRRTTVGFIFQSFGLLEALTALENVELAAMLAGERPGVRRQLSCCTPSACRLGRHTDRVPSPGGTSAGGHRAGASEPSPPGPGR